MENIDPLPMHSFSPVRVDADSFPTESRISVNTATAGAEEISISYPRHGKRQLDPNDSNQLKKRKTQSVRSTSTTNANADADYQSEDSDDEAFADDIPTTPSFNGRRILPPTAKTSTISNRSDNYLLEDLHLQHSKLERRFLQPLLVAIQRQSEILKDLVDEQKKIIRGLRRRHVSAQVSFA
jgi:hypothetical protein